MSTVLVTGGSGFIGSHSHPAAPRRGPSGAHHGAEPEARGRRARAMLKGRRRRAGRSLCPSSAADLEKDAGWAGGRRRLRIRAARGVAVSAGHPQARGRADRARARGRLARAARLARRGRQARGADVVVRRDRLWPRAAERAVRRDELDRPQRRRRAALREVEDAGRARGLGFHRQGGRQRSSSRSSIRWASSVRSSGPTIRPRSCSCSA